MEGNVMVIKCPNCGANATNHSNCEYCGSLLVRFFDKDIPLPPATEIYDKNLFLPGVHDAVVSHWQRHESDPKATVSTIFIPMNYEESAIQIVSNDSGDVMTMDFILENEDQIATLKKFPDYALLDVREDNKNELLASIDFGHDIEYATKFISTFLREIFNQPADAPVKWIKDENKKSGRGCLITILIAISSTLSAFWIL